MSHASNDGIDRKECSISIGNAENYERCDAGECNILFVENPGYDNIMLQRIDFKSNVEANVLTSADLLHFAIQIASGMVKYSYI